MRPDPARVGLEPQIDRVEDRSVDDRRVLAGIAARLMADLTDIDRVGQEMVDPPARESDATEGFPAVDTGDIC